MKFKWFYIVGWSVALFVATFPSVLKGELSFSLRNKLVDDACDVYIFPLLMALTLLTADVLYETEQEKANEGARNSSLLIICVIGFLFCFVFSLWSSISWLCWLFFFLAWFCMTILKFIKTSPIKESNYKPINVVSED